MNNKEYLKREVEAINRKSEYIKEGRQIEKQKIIEEIENLPNPYPLDIFPKLKDWQLREINNWLLRTKGFEFPLDRLSAELMRRARENVKQELLNSLGEKE